jgi:hypothetical protein
MNIFNRIGKRLPGMLGNNHGFAGTIAALIAIGGAVGVGGAGVAAGLAGAAIAGSAAFGLGSLLTAGSRGGPSNLTLPAPQTQSAESLLASSNQAAEDKRKDILRAKRRKTVLTGPTGLFEEADTAKKTLLGA